MSGDRDAATALAAGNVRVSGAAHDARQLWNWLGRSGFAATREQARAA
jgi:hypothetical protein